MGILNLDGSYNRLLRPRKWHLSRWSQRPFR